MFGKKVQWLAENLVFALTGDADGAETLVFERDGRQFTGRAAFDAYEAQIEAEQERQINELRRRWQGDDSPDFARAAQSLRQRYEVQLAELRQQFAGRT